MVFSLISLLQIYVRRRGVVELLVDLLRNSKYSYLYGCGCQRSGCLIFVPHRALGSGDPAKLQTDALNRDEKFFTLS